MTRRQLIHNRSEQLLKSMNTSKPSKKITANVSGWLFYVCAFLFVVTLFFLARVEQSGSVHVHKNEPPIHDSAKLAFDEIATELPIVDSISMLGTTQPAFPVAQANEIPVDVSDQQKLQTTSFQVESPVGRVLVVRGIMTVFSLGMNELGRKLQASGYDVRVTPAIKASTEVESISRQILARRDNIPLVIIGHSLGGDIAPKLAANFARHKIPVDLLIMLDSTMPASPPSNVKHCINMYQSSNISPFQGRRLENRSRHTTLVNIDIRRLAAPEMTKSIHHFNIDTNPWVQDLLVESVHRGEQIRSANDLLIRQPVVTAPYPMQYPLNLAAPLEFSAPLESAIQMTFGDSQEGNWK